MCCSNLKRFSLIIIAIFLSACSANFDEAFETANEFKVQIHESGKSVREYKVLSGTEKYLKFEKWVQENEWGWKLTPATYVPGVVVTGGGYVFNFVGDSVVVNNPNGQYSKDIKKSEYDFFY